MFIKLQVLHGFLNELIFCNMVVLTFEYYFVGFQQSPNHHPYQDIFFEHCEKNLCVLFCNNLLNYYHIKTKK